MADLYPLAWSTLGCPDWTFEQAAEHAAANGYRALEVRLLDRDIIPADLPAGLAEVRTAPVADPVVRGARGADQAWCSPG